MLLVEYNVLEKVQVITEGKGTNQRKKLRGKFQKCDEQNNNGRVYPRKILENQVKAIKEKIDDRSLVGALDHPSNDAIHLSQASHLITNLWVEKNGDVMGECEILSTPNGKIVEALLNDGVKIGISSRGLGSVSEGTNGKVVNEDFKLITFDLVSDPSTKGAFPAMSESMRENSQRAQEIVSKHKKDRVLLTMLESKIRDSLTENVVGLSKEEKRQKDVNAAVKAAQKRGNRPLAARLTGVQAEHLKGKAAQRDKRNADKAAIKSRNAGQTQGNLPFPEQAEIGKKVEEGSIKNDPKAFKKAQRKYRRKQQGLSSKKRFDSPSNHAAQTGSHYSDLGRGSVHPDGNMQHPEDIKIADKRGERLRKRKALQAKIGEAIVNKLKETGEVKRRNKAAKRDLVKAEGRGNPNLTLGQTVAARKAARHEPKFSGAATVRAGRELLRGKKPK